MKALRAGIAGGSGYVGLELLRYLHSHPDFSVAAVTSREHCGKPLSDVHRGFAGITELCFTDNIAALAELDVVFTAVPHGESMRLVAQLRAIRTDLPVIDLGADFRVSQQLFEQVYGEEHHCPELLQEAVYGVPELHRERISKARLIANPGCFAHCNILALAPLAMRGLLVGPTRVSAITGSSGSGAHAKAVTHHPERNDSVSAYNVLAHRHVPEIERALGETKPVSIQLVPLSGPFSRGIFATVFVTVIDATINVGEIYDEFAATNRFVRRRQVSPRLLDVRGTNFCDIAVHQSRSDVVIISAIDNLGKGAAANAVQCANLMFGLPEESGLLNPPLAP